MTEEYSIPPETIMSPRAREIARENNLHLSDLPKKGSGKDGGFTVPDVNKAVKKAVKKAKKAEKIAKIARNNDNQKEYERRFAEHHDGTYLDDQEIGSAVDFIDKNEKKVEIKFIYQL